MIIKLLNFDSDYLRAFELLYISVFPVDSIK